MKTTDLHNQISVGVGIALTAVADGADVVGSIIDMQGCNALEFVFQVGEYTDGSVTPLIEESDNSDMSAPMRSLILIYSAQKRRRH